MPNGLDVEKTLFERLEAAGFRLAPYHETADEEHKVDRVILGPPPIDSPFWLAPAMAIQVTLKVDQWQKMWVFQKVAQRIAPRMAYLELVIDNNELTDKAVRVIGAALLQLYYNKAAPTNARIKATERSYMLDDLDAALKPYNDWLSNFISGEITGRINYWSRPVIDQDGVVQQGGYGFVQGGVRGPDNEPEMSFFFHISRTDVQLRDILNQFDGDIPMGKQPSVIFEDAGPATDYPRKAAKRLRLVNPPAAATVQAETTPAEQLEKPAEQLAA